MATLTFSKIIELAAVIDHMMEGRTVEVVLNDRERVLTYTQRVSGQTADDTVEMLDGISVLDVPFMDLVEARELGAYRAVRI